MWGWAHSALDAYARSCVASVALVAAALHAYLNQKREGVERVGVPCKVEGRLATRTRNTLQDDRSDRPEEGASPARDSSSPKT
eukprot:4910622-Prymnesium_polylepis.1